MSDHGPYPHPEIDGCDEFCPREWPGHGPYPHARRKDCTDLCSERDYSMRAERARARWERSEYEKWRRHGESQPAEGRWKAGTRGFSTPEGDSYRVTGLGGDARVPSDEEIERVVARLVAAANGDAP